MTGAQFGSLILVVLVVAAVVAIVAWLLNWLYLRSSKERAFVRTGFGGQKVVLNGGALVLPIIHEVIPVNMNTLRLEVTRGRERALITKDRMRVDVTAEFYVRVQAAAEAIAAAAQTLGQRTMQPEMLKELVEGKFVDALRTVAAEMSMEEMHEKRGDDDAADDPGNARSAHVCLPIRLNCFVCSVSAVSAGSRSMLDAP